MLYKVIDSLIKFPLWKNDGMSSIILSEIQKKYISIFLDKIKKHEYRFVENPCLCGNMDRSFDLLISEKDRYGIPCKIVLCKKCGLIRLKERLDDYSTTEFYRNEYRGIYVGEELASNKFFKDQYIRGQTFLNLIKSYINLNEVNTVFEVGCGAGGVIYPFYEINKQVSGCDFGEKYLKFGQNKGLFLYEGEINPNKTPMNSQDLIILSHVMEHFNHPIERINQIIEYVKTGKYLIIEVPGIFAILNIYFNPILYFQNAHVYNYYYYYLKVFFETLGLEVIYGNERCTLLLRKPKNWTKKEIVSIENIEFTNYAKKVEYTLKKYKLIHLLKLNPYYYNRCLIRILDMFGLKNVIKKLLGR